MPHIVCRSDADTATATWDKISAASLIASGVLRARAANTGTISVRWASDTTNTAVLAAGDQFPLVNVNLAEIEVQASAASQGWDFVGDNSRGLV